MHRLMCAACLPNHGVTGMRPCVRRRGRSQISKARGGLDGLQESTLGLLWYELVAY